MSKLIIQTLSWNGYDKLEKLKNSLLPALDILHLSWQWDIKDNGSKDNTVEQVKNWNHPNINVFAYPNNNQNFSEGMNYLFHQSSPNDEDYILLLNNDIVCNDKFSIKNMVELMEKDETVGAVGAKLLYTDSDLIQHSGVIFNNYGATHFRSKEKCDSHAEKNREFQVVTGAVLLTKAKYYKNICTTNKSGISGFEEKMIWMYDDVDACLAIKYNLNKKIIYCGNTNFFHEESASLKKNPRNKLFMNHNFNLLKSKWSKHYKVDSQDYERNVNHNLYKK
jgi:GT2 family glycosyltransferase